MRTQEIGNTKKKSIQKWPKVAIIILNWNGWKDTIECLESVFRNNYPNYQVIVVDNGSTDGSMGKIKAWADGKQKVLTPEPTHPLHHLSHPPVKKPISYIYYTREEAEKGSNFELEEKVTRKWQERRKVNSKELNPASTWPLIFIQTGKNLGFAGGNNVGMRYALEKDYNYILLLNNDTVVEQNFLEKAVEITEKNNKIGIVGGKIYYYGDIKRIWAVCGKYHRLRGAVLYRGQNQIDNGQYNGAQNVQFSTGALMLIKREVLEKVGLLPEKYFFGTEEWDFSFDVFKNGYELYYVPGFIIWHKVARSFIRSDPKYIYNMYRCKFLLVEKIFSRLHWKIWFSTFRIYYMFLARWKFFRLIRGFNVDVESDNLLKIISVAISDHKKKKKVTLEDLEKVEKMFKKGKNI